LDQRPHLDQGNNEGAQGHRANVIAHDAPDTAQHRAAHASFVARKVPSGHNAGNCDLLAADDELCHPEEPEQMVPPVPIEFRDGTKTQCHDRHIATIIVPRWGKVPPTEEANIVTG